MKKERDRTIRGTLVSKVKELNEPQSIPNVPKREIDIKARVQ